MSPDWVLVTSMCVGAGEFAGAVTSVGRIPAGVDGLETDDGLSDVQCDETIASCPSALAE